MSRDSSKIREFGSEVAQFRVSDAAGSYTGAVKEMPLIEDHTFGDETAQNDRPDAGGNVYTVDGARTITYSGNLMQTDPDTIQLFSKTHRDDLLFIVQELNKTDGTYLVMPSCKVNPTFSLSTPGGQVPMSFRVQALSTSIDVDMADWDDPDFAATLSGTLTVPTEGWAIHTQS